MAQPRADTIAPLLSAPLVWRAQAANYDRARSLPGRLSETTHSVGRRAQSRSRAPAGENTRVNRTPGTVMGARVRRGFQARTHLAPVVRAR